MHPSWPQPDTHRLPKRTGIPIAIALKIRQLVLGQGCLEAPIEIHRVLEYAGIEHREGPYCEGSGSGCLLPFSRLIIYTDSRLQRRDLTKYYGDRELMKRKQRITIAHEIGHTIFYKREGKAGSLEEIVPYDWSSWIFDHTSDLEYFCEVFGASLLLSPWTLKLRPRYLSMSNELLAEYFGVPVKVVRWIRYGFPRDFFNAECLFMADPD